MMLLLVRRVDGIVMGLQVRPLLPESSLPFSFRNAFMVCSGNNPRLHEVGRVLKRLNVPSNNETPWDFVVCSRWCQMMS